ncbi:hypothetical protein LSG31_10920 [Fodinisporobacter ferrooxydans]|uniref:Uncharacterized protein n=1 Tax=Fodinisporobacter ferrooxydans TaxID=2901836 RepID=A0ABY4CQM1_9BACL|nr:hypothetical protein LSG31_10920 [Alicyclobacillaceae bacterium MYW30-H2]
MVTICYFGLCVLMWAMIVAIDAQLFNFSFGKSADHFFFIVLGDEKWFDFSMFLIGLLFGIREDVLRRKGKR